jgi:ABC-2 type transport system permease protein
MNTQSSAMPATSTESQAMAPVAISETRRLYWSIRREMWESRSIYIAPLAMAAIFLLGFLLSLFHLPAKMREALTLDAAQQHRLIEQPYDYVALLVMGTAFVVGLIYSLEALHGERRDRSILFWKSLPVSDLTAVLSKASIPIVILPLMSFGITVAVQFVMLLLSTVVLGAAGVDVGPLWREVAFFSSAPLLLYHLVTVHMLWYAPIYGWLLLVSSWARRMVFVWAALPIVAIGVVEKIAFGTSNIVASLMNRLNGGPEAEMVQGRFPMDPQTHLTPGHFLISGSLWIGLALTAAFLAGAVRMRRHRGPI